MNTMPAELIELLKKQDFKFEPSEAFTDIIGRLISLESKINAICVILPFAFSQALGLKETEIAEKMRVLAETFRGDLVAGLLSQYEVFGKDLTQ
jgi:hypothetical protein